MNSWTKQSLRKIYKKRLKLMLFHHVIFRKNSIIKWRLLFRKQDLGSPFLSKVNTFRGCFLALLFRNLAMIFMDLQQCFYSFQLFMCSYSLTKFQLVLLAYCKVLRKAIMYSKQIWLLCFYLSFLSLLLKGMSIEVILRLLKSTKNL